MNPKISIIVPVYKVEQYIRECLDSIIASTFSDFELLLVDDGSPDQCGAICDEYAQKDLRINVFHKTNGGVSSARNLGLDNAKGEWVTFIDSDDLISPTFLEGLYCPIAKGENVDFVQGGNTNFEGGKPTTINYSFQDSVGTEKKVVLNDMVGLTVSKLFSLENVRRGSDGLPIRFDEKMSICEDMAFTLDYLMTVKRYAFVRETGYYYRRDNETSALHISAKKPDYDQARDGFKHLKYSLDRYVSTTHLTYDDAIPIGSHLAVTMMNCHFFMFKLNFDRKTRFNKYVNDWGTGDRRLLDYYDSTYLRNVSAFLLKKKLFVLFDYYTQLLFCGWSIRSHKLRK